MDVLKKITSFCLYGKSANQKSLTPVPIDENLIQYRPLLIAIAALNTASQDAQVVTICDAIAVFFDEVSSTNTP